MVCKNVLSRTHTRKGHRHFALAVLCVMLFCVAFSSMPYLSASANSAPMRPADNGMGIVFTQHDSVKIERETLDIHVHDDLTATIKANYVMVNSSNAQQDVQAMFLASATYGDNKDINITIDGTTADFSEQFFLHEHEFDETLADFDWEKTVSSFSQPSKPLGEGQGFYEYVLSETKSSRLYAIFRPKSLYFYEAEQWSIDDENITLANQEYYGNMQDIVIVTQDKLSEDDFFTNARHIEINEIENIYDYLFDRAVDNTYSEEELRFSEQQFNLYLSQLDTEYWHQGFFYFWYVYSYIGAYIYDVQFEPKEKLEVTVSYTYQMGANYRSDEATLHYYLTPAKYWMDFAELEINLYLGEEYRNLKHSSLPFDYYSEGVYQYISQSLPEQELYICASNPSMKNSLWAIVIMTFVIIYLIALVPVAILIILIMAIMKFFSN